jgi:hypothetical protein
MFVVIVTDAEDADGEPEAFGPFGFREQAEGFAKDFETGFGTFGTELSVVEVTLPGDVIFDEVNP